VTVLPGAPAGVGIGWRREIDLTVERLPGVDFVAVVAEDLRAEALPASLETLRGRGMPVLPHAVSLSLGGAEPLRHDRVEHLAAVADTLGAPLASDHVAFVRAGGLESGHLLPVPRTREALGVLVDNVRATEAVLGVPLALENIAPLLAWPDAEMTKGAFLAELCARTGAWLLLDVANLHASAVNLGQDPEGVLDELPLERVVYMHAAGGVERDGVYHDTHAHPLTPEVLDLLDALCGRHRPPAVLLERDERYPPDDELAAELAALRAVHERARV
jgi:uncharacterized protein (UPF0276 family)